MVNVDKLEELGTEVDVAHPMWNEIETFVRNSPEAITIGEFQNRAHGVMRRVTEIERREFDLPEDAAAVLWWIRRREHHRVVNRG